MPADRVELRMITIIVALGVAFGIVGAWVEIAGSFPGDRMLLEAVHRWFGRRADGAMEGIDAATDTWPLGAVAVAAAVALLATGRWRDGAVLVAPVVAAMLANPWWKDLFARPRPTVRPIPVEVSEHAFPSGHATTSAALVVGALLAARTPRARLVVVAVGGAFLVIVAAAQLALSAHAPSDILGGWLWIGAWGAVVGLIRRRMDLIGRRER